MEKNLYIIYTPYHVFLSLLISQSIRAENHFIVFKDFDASNFFENSFCKDLNKINKNISVEIIGGQYEKNRVGRIIALRQGAKRIKKIASRESFNRIFIFNDELPPSQAAIYYAPGNSSIIKVEDGSESYIDYEKKFCRRKELLKKIIYNFSYKHLPRMGFHPRLNELWVLFPELVCAGLKKRFSEKIKPIPKSLDNIYELLGASIDEIERIIIKENYFNPLDIAVFLLPHSEIVNSKTVHFTKEIIEKKKKKSLVYVKYHPRDAKGWFSTGGDNVYLLPKDFPAELLFCAIKKNMSKGLVGGLEIYGDFSTSLITAKWLFEESNSNNRVSIYSYGRLVNSSRFLKFKNLFQALDINIL